MNKRSAFITFEGCVGAGKSSNVPFVKKTLEALGYRVVVTREPGGCELSEEIRELVLSHRMSQKTELLLFAAARAEHLEQTIYPALVRGDIVLCDRFADSTHAYQGWGRGVPLGRVMRLDDIVLEGFRPDHTLFFDITLEESERRLLQRSGERDRFDAAERDFKQRVWQGYQQRFRLHPGRMVRVDAMQDLHGVRAQLLTWVQKTFPAIH